MTMRQLKSTAIDNPAGRPGRAGPAPAKPGASPRANHERYLALARAKALAGDRIEAERYFQHAEHYQRLLNGSAA